jgi:hypothetical protein
MAGVNQSTAPAHMPGAHKKSRDGLGFFLDDVDLIGGARY